MTRLHVLYCALACAALWMIRMGHKARARSRDVKARMQRREEELLTQFPQLAQGLQAQRRNGR